MPTEPTRSLLSKVGQGIVSFASGKTQSEIGTIRSGRESAAQQVTLNQQNIEANEAQIARAQRQQQLTDAAFGGGPDSDAASAQLSVEFPEVFEQISESMGLRTEGQKNEAADFALRVRNTPFESRQPLIDERVNKLSAVGRDPQHTATLTGQSEEEQNNALRVTELLALSPEDRQTRAAKATTAGQAERRLEIAETAETRAAATAERTAGQAERRLQISEAKEERAAGERETKRDVNDELRFVDTGERVFPDVVEAAGGVREGKIADLMDQGLSRADSANIADGNVKIEVLESGVARLTNVVDGSVKEVPIQPSGEAIPGPEEGQTLFELAPLATGLTSGISAGISRVGGQFAAPVNEEVLQARQTLRIAKNGLIRSLSINPRFPVAEIKRIEGEVNLDPSLFNSPEAMQADMIAMDRALRLRMNQELRDANDPSMSEDKRGDARSAASDINNFLTQLGVPEELDASLITIDTIPTLSKIDLNRFIQSATDEELNALSPEVADLLFERIQSGR